MRPLLKYGVPAAAGLATGGYALSQGEDPGSAALAAGLGGLGGAAGLLASRQLAGKYNPQLLMRMQGAISGAGNAVGNYARNLPDESVIRKNAANIAADAISAVDNRLMGVPGVSNAALPFPTQNVQRNISKGLAAGMVPASAAAAGLGGVALGAVPAAMGMPGFQQGIDPESYTSSNMPGARQSISTLQY